MFYILKYVYVGLKKFFKNRMNNNNVNRNSNLIDKMDLRSNKIVYFLFKFKWMIKRLNIKFWGVKLFF